jgi:PAS domain-containing protein
MVRKREHDESAGGEVKGGYRVKESSPSHEIIKKTKNEWETTFNAIPELIMILDDRHRILRMNVATAERLDLTPDETVGLLTCYEHVHGTKEPPEFCPHAKLLKTGQRHFVEVHEESSFCASKSGLHECVIKDKDPECVKGVFIATKESVSVGDVVTIELPASDKKKGKKLKGVIVRKAPDGIGVHFKTILNG